MRNSSLELILGSLSVGNWLQTLLFYSFLVLLFGIILVQMHIQPIKFKFNFIKRVIKY
jgi:hypothetical protein